MKNSRRKKFQIRRPKGQKKIPAADLPPPPPWIDLPRDVTANILHRLGAIEILESAQKVCTTWRSVCQDSSLWRVIDMKYPDERHVRHYETDMCRRAVDRSRGELIDINIEYFGTDKLLDYISERSGHLRRLRLACCDGISSKGFTEAVRKLPELEELHLFFMPSICAEDIEAIGISCPKLKSFTFNGRGYRFPLIDVNDNYALAIAKNMPNLHHLRLFGNRLTDEGVQAILDSCPHLESLDLRQCFNVDLQRDLGKRCSQRIKDFRGPYDKTSDYEWDAEIYDDEDDSTDPYDYDDAFGHSDFFPVGPFDDYTDPFNDDYPFGHTDFYTMVHFDDYTNPYNNDYFFDGGDFF